MFFCRPTITRSGFLLIGRMLLALIMWQQIICVGRDALRVFLWSVGNLILESTSFSFDLSPELLKLGMWMQNAAPDALIAVEAYAQEKAF
jgi:hypothetical protein